MFKKVLIANRGEIACRITETLKRLGIISVAVYSEADRDARHVRHADEAVCIGGPAPADSYLKGDQIIAQALALGCDAIHPGYGFLAENAGFARACSRAGIAFIGPSAEAIEKMGSKSESKRIMEAAGVPVVPGYHGDRQETAFLEGEAEQIGYPIMIKAIAGGGGKGMRRVERASDFVASLDAARREAKGAFGDDQVLLERFVTEPRHIEIQIFGDSQGGVVHLFERECSIQRRHQKILEETPSLFIDDEQRQRMGQAAVAAAQAIQYSGAGTVEFIVGADREFFFMEMNTRLQVEHPVTELTTGQDLVEWQLKVASGEPLPLEQVELDQQGHAIEVRLYAEDPDNQFLPVVGELQRLEFPLDLPGVRVDTGIDQGDSISVHYDPMIAKLIAYGQDRAEAAQRLSRLLSEIVLVGPVTNLPFLQRLVQHPGFLSGDTDTGFVDAHLPALLSAESELPEMVLLAATARQLVTRNSVGLAAGFEGGDPWSPFHRSDGWRLLGHQTDTLIFDCDQSGRRELRFVPGSGQFQLVGRKETVEYRAIDNCRIELTIDGITHRILVAQQGAQFWIQWAGAAYRLSLFDELLAQGGEADSLGGLSAPMPGRVIDVRIAEGARVVKGDVLILLEAMKMEHSIIAPIDGIVTSVACATGDQVDSDVKLVVIEEELTAEA
ncbi:MAG: acetyl/propionyl/methylcrotonyl-CoA carboxylase subunit alpha [Gammaproteobacteria bacterium]|nr:acetyl/propionyl/methylcrotonyl-CoA carboxylase subunit alpha [Gammaproteobacteria bacterium]